MTTDKDIMIASLRNELQNAYKKISAMEQEIAVLNYDNDRLKGRLEQLKK